MKTLSFYTPPVALEAHRVVHQGEYPGFRFNRISKTNWGLLLLGFRILDATNSIVSSSTSSFHNSQLFLNIAFTFTDVPGLDNAYSTAIADTTLSPLSRGHMNPLALNTFHRSFMKATFTLSNAVPQFERSNSGPWQEFETRIRNYAKNTCGPQGGTLYLLTGKSDYGVRIQAGSPVQEITTALPYLRENFPGNVKLVTPRAVWTAGCCVWAEPGKYFGNLWPAKKAESFAVMSNNKNADALLYQTEMSVSQLERLLTPPLLEGVKLFPGNENCRRAENGITLPL